MISHLCLEMLGTYSGFHSINLPFNPIFHRGNVCENIWRCKNSAPSKRIHAHQYRVRALERFETYYPGGGGQTEVTPDQTSFERTHVPGALELHGLEKASSALLSGQWSGTCLIRGHFVLGRSDQRQFQAHTSLIRGRFERTLV